MRRGEQLGYNSRPSATPPPSGIAHLLQGPLSPPAVERQEAIVPSTAVNLNQKAGMLTAQSKVHLSIASAAVRD